MQHPPPSRAGQRSPAALVAAATGIPAGFLALIPAAFPVALFLALAALVALPLALSDRAGPASTRLALLGAAGAVVAVALVGGRLVTAGPLEEPAAAAHPTLATGAELRAA